MRLPTIISGLLILTSVLAAAQDASAFYNPMTGQFLHRDPIADPAFRQQSPVPLQGGRFLNRDRSASHLDGMNLYEYVGSNPTNAVDPTGLFKEYSWCDATKKAAIQAAENNVSGAISKLVQDIDNAINNGPGPGSPPYTPDQVKKLKDAKKVLDCAKGKLSPKKAACECPGGECQNTIAYVYAPFGDSVHLCPDFFYNANYNSRTSQTGTLIHELTHFCGVGDAHGKGYFSPGNPPHDVNGHDWSDIADTYWYWVTYGFIVPP